MARLQDYQTVTPTASDKLLVVQSQGQGLTTIGDFKSDKMDKANPTGTGSLSLNKASGSTLGTNAVTLGTNNTASGNQSVALGANSTASGSASFAQGSSATASGVASQSEGYETIANHLCQHVFGEYNVADTSTAASTARGAYVEIVGNGSSNSERSNARTLDWSGNEVLAGGLKINGTTDVGQAIDDLTNSLVTAKLTYNGTYFTLETGTPKPHGRNQITLLGRNTSTGAIYSLWYDDSIASFRVASIISGSAPSVNNNCYVQYFA